MREISVDEIMDGMVLARDVFGSTGSALLGKGTALNASLGRRLKSWGVTTLSVEGEGVAKMEKETVVHQTEEAHLKLQQKFARVMSHDQMAKLYAAVNEFRNGHKKD